MDGCSCGCCAPDGALLRDVALVAVRDERYLFCRWRNWGRPTLSWCTRRWFATNSFLSSNAKRVMFMRCYLLKVHIFFYTPSFKEFTCVQASDRMHFVLKSISLHVIPEKQHCDIWLSQKYPKTLPILQSFEYALSKCFSLELQCHFRVHYPDTNSTPLAQKLGKPLWSSEDHSDSDVAVSYYVQSQ